EARGRTTRTRPRPPRRALPAGATGGATARPRELLRERTASRQGASAELFHGPGSPGAPGCSCSVLLRCSSKCYALGSAILTGVPARAGTTRTTAGAVVATASRTPFPDQLQGAWWVTRCWPER